jgi:hypothetical protein
MTVLSLGVRVESVPVGRDEAEHRSESRFANLTPPLKMTELVLGRRSRALA